MFVLHNFNVLLASLDKYFRTKVFRHIIILNKPCRSYGFLKKIHWRFFQNPLALCSHGLQVMLHSVVSCYHERWLYKKIIYHERWLYYKKNYLPWEMSEQGGFIFSSYTFQKKKNLLAVCCLVDHNPISLVLTDGTLYMVYLTSFAIVILDQEIVAKLYLYSIVELFDSCT
jgi:hypothetical protein